MTSTPPEQPALPTVALPASSIPAEDIVVPRVRLRREHAWPLLGIAVLLGLAADALFYDAGLGVNVPLWLATGIAAVVLASRQMGVALERDRLTMLLAALSCSVVFVWRDSDALSVLNLLAGWTLFALALAPRRGADARLPRLTNAIVSCLGLIASAVTSPFRLGERIPWSGGAEVHRRVPSAVSVRALLIALPAFLVFAVLFMAADAVFADALGGLFDLNLDFGRVAPHVALFVVGTWLAITALWSGVAVERGSAVVVEVPDQSRLRAGELSIILGPLVLLFALFVLVQLRYLFGGAELVEQSLDLTYAEYARRGFFELVMAAMLLLPLLTGVNWARRADAKTKTAFLVLSGALVALMFVIMLSAWQRLAMYRATFGLTELRFYTAATLPWLAAIFLWLAIAVVRDRPRWFFPGMVWASFIALGVLNVINPDALIARTNAGELASRRPFDAAYVASLSQDAVPPLLDRIEALPAVDRCELAAWLLPRLQDDDGLRGWNLARHQARAAIEVHRGALERACEAPRA